MQGTQDLHLGHAVGAVEGQVDRQHMQLKQVGCHFRAVRRQHRVRCTGAHVACPSFCVIQHGSNPCVHARRNPARQHQPMDQRCGQDADGDFLHPRDGDGEHLSRHHHRRKPDQAGGIAGQQERIGTWRAVEHRQVQAQRHPGRERGAQHQGCIGETWYQHDGGDGPAHGTEQAEQAAAECRPGKGLRHQIDRADHPERAVQADPQRDIQPQRRGEQAFEREQHRLLVGPEGRAFKPRKCLEQVGAERAGGVHAAHPSDRPAWRISLQ